MRQNMVGPTTRGQPASRQALPVHNQQNLPIPIKTQKKQLSAVQTQSSRTTYRAAYFRIMPLAAVRCWSLAHQPLVGLSSTNPQNSKKKRKRKTYNRRDSLLVTHATTNRPQRSLSMEERTGFRILYVLWSYVKACVGT
ncbi:hypothetical protein IWZ00DRAFT_35013 [Phyllosticta capitalensis]